MTLEKSEMSLMMLEKKLICYERRVRVHDQVRFSDRENTFETT